MAIPKTKKLQDEEAVRAASQSQPSIAMPAEPSLDSGPVLIRPVECQNDFVAVLQSTYDTNIELAGIEGKFINEGLVIGVGPGVADGAGGRLKPTLEVGDYVMFGPRNIAATLDPSDGPYKGKKVVIVSERNVICKLPSDIEWELVESD